MPPELEGDLEDDLAADVVPPAKKSDSKHEFSPSLHLPDPGRQQQILQDNELDLLALNDSHRRILPFSWQTCPAPKNTQCMHFYSLPR